MKNDYFTVLVSGGGRPTEWACVLCRQCIQNDWGSRATNLHRILRQAWTFLHRNYLDDSEGCSHGQLVIGSFITTTHPLIHHVWWNIKSPRWLSSSTAQIWCPVISALEPIPSTTTREKPHRLLPISSRLCLEFLLPFKILSFGKDRWLQHNHQGGLVCSWSQSVFRHLSGACMCVASAGTPPPLSAPGGAGGRCQTTRSPGPTCL